MKAILWIFKVWLVLCFVLAFFVVPFYFVAIYPEVPESYHLFSRKLGYGVLQAKPSPMAFAYRFLSCGLVVAIGMFMAWIFLRDILRNESEPEEKHDAP